MEAMAQKTILYDEHQKLNAKIVDFHGWLMPVSYDGTLSEHETVRTKVGIFDVSHMGEILVEGPKSFEFLQHMTTNDIAKLADGQGQYSALCNESAGVIDDLILYRQSSTRFFLCVNASNAPEDFAWLSMNAQKLYPTESDLTLTNLSSAYSQIAIQGPLSEEALICVLGPNHREMLSGLGYMHIKSFTHQGEGILIARTGYTGEKGYEVYLPNPLAVSFWRELLSKNQSLGIKPIGLGARDTLRLEACYLLHGNDMNQEISPLEVGLGWITKLSKGAFVGSGLLQKQKDTGPKHELHAFLMEEKSIPRSGMSVLDPVTKKPIGRVTSGSVLPTVGGSGGLAFLAKHPDLVSGARVLIDIRGSHKEAKLVKKPFYSAKTK